MALAGTPSGRPVVVSGILKIAQCSTSSPPMATSGSCRMRAILIVPAGAPDHSMAGDRLAFLPFAQPYLAGMAPPSAKAGMVILSGAGMPPPLPPRCADAIPRPSVNVTTKIPAFRIGDFLFLSGPGDFPDGRRGFIRHIQGAVLACYDADRPAPGLSVGRQKTGQEILVYAIGFPFVQRHAHDFMTRDVGPVPRPVLSREQIAAVFGGELRTVIEGQAERGVVRLQQNVGDDDGIDGFVGRPGNFRPRVFVLADIEPRPAVEAMLLDRGDVIGNEIVAQVVALVHG